MYLFATMLSLFFVGRITAQSWCGPLPMVVTPATCSPTGALDILETLSDGLSQGCRIICVRASTAAVLPPATLDEELVRPLQ